MQTQCPHCDTRFRVTESQVNTADGFVRCSVCKEIFNAFEVAEQNDFQQSLLDQEINEKEPSLADSQNDVITEITAEHTDNDHEDSAVPLENPDFNETSGTDDSRKDAFDFFDEDSNESLSHVVPEKYKDTYTSGSPALLPILFWSAGILLLSASLLAEYIWFNRDQLNRTPQFQHWSKVICKQINCEDIAVRDPAKIELVSRNVYSHPNEKNALMVNITMKNNAAFSQPYPVMQINFSDVRGGTVAARRFRPIEYLPAEILQLSSQQLFEPDTNMTFTMEIQDPGDQAMTYEFDFL